MKKFEVNHVYPRKNQAGKRSGSLGKDCTSKIQDPDVTEV